MPEESTSSQINVNSTKYSYKKIPPFDPTFYRAWASDVQDAFAEREWSDYLFTPTNEKALALKLDPLIVIQAKAFLNQSISYEHKAGLEECTTAAQIWLALEQRYASKSREDELRLEGQLLDFKKIAADSIDRHIAKFDSLIASVIAQQPLNQRYDDTKKNRYFLRTLETSNIPGEDWKGFITFLGKTWLQMTTHALFAEARTYYNTHIQPYLKSSSSPQTSHSSTDPPPPPAPSEPTVMATQATQHPPHFNQRGRGRVNFRGNSNHRGNFRGRGRGRSNYNSNRSNEQRNEYPRDPNGYCTNCKIPGHRVDQCMKLRQQQGLPPQYSSQSHSSHSSPQQSPPEYSPLYSRGSTSQGPREPRAYVTQACSASLTSSDTSDHQLLAKSDTWVYDTACTNLMTNDLRHFLSFNEFEIPEPVTGSGGSTLYAYGMGTIVVKDKRAHHIHYLHDVWYVPYLKNCMISHEWILQNGLYATLDSNLNFILYSNNGFSTSTESVNQITVLTNLRALHFTPVPQLSNNPVPVLQLGTPAVNFTTVNPANANANDNANPIRMHQRLGHASQSRLRLLNIVFNAICDACIRGKQTRSPFLDIPDSERVLVKLGRVYCDHCGPISPPSFGNASYILVLIDELTRYSWIFAVPNRSSITTLPILTKWKAMVENQAGSTVQIFRSDMAKEFMQGLLPFFDKHGIIHETTPGYSSSSNGIAERLNRTLLDMVRPMLLNSNMPTPFWAEAVETANKIRNRLPSTSLPNNMSPHQAWFGTAPSIDHFRQFGCVAYAKSPQIPRGNKLEPRSIKCCLLGFIGNRIYRLWDPNQQRIVTSRDVLFNEGEFLDFSLFPNIKNSEIAFSTPFDDVLDDEIRDPAEFQPPTLPSRLPYLPSSSSTPSSSSAPTHSSSRVLAAPIPPVPRFSDSDSDSDSDFDVLFDFQDAPATPFATPPTSPPTSPIHPVASTSAPIPSTSAPTLQATPASSPLRIPPPLSIRQSHRVQVPTEKARQNAALRAAAQARKEAAKARREAEAQAEAQAQITVSAPLPPPDDPPLPDPRTIDEALRTSQADLWYRATLEEIESLRKNGTFVLVERPLDRKVIRTKWVYKLKDPDTPTPRYKARLVAQGFHQINGVDYTDTFSPVVRPVSLRTLFALAAQFAMHIHQFDIETAFLNPTIDHDIYVEQPPGFEMPGYPPDQWVLRLNKALYGLKQSPLLWNTDLKQKLFSLGFIQSDADESIFVLPPSDSNAYIIIAVYVDDLLALSPSVETIEYIHAKINESFKCRNLGKVKTFLGIDVARHTDTGSVYISQSRYLRRILRRFNMHQSNPVQTPLDPSFSLHRRTEDEEPADAELYRQMVGSVMHLAVFTRPDIAFAVSKLSQFLSDPSILHFRAVKHVFRYLNGTITLCILYLSHHDKLLPIGFTDASYATDPDDRKSHSGHVFFLADGPISWQSQKQTVVALSSMESEYIALSDASKEAVFLRKLHKSLQLHLLGSQELRISIPISIYTDSRSALDHVKNNVKHQRTKHIDTRHHYIRSVYGKEVDIHHIEAASQAADILTKPLAHIKHKNALEMLRLNVLNIVDARDVTGPRRGYLSIQRQQLGINSI
jgi:Reverse transcriptase (RNA-dependent DNA polymerase)/gag-polypeptide of LTR copia-type